MVTIDHSFGYKHGAIVNHPLILIQGQLRNQIQSGIEVTNLTSGETINWPVVSSKFKALILLKPGLNVIILRHGFYSKEVNYTYILRQSPYIVQPLYIITKDDTGCFQAPPDVDNSAEAACARISLNTALLQTFTAMNMKAHNLGAHTFQLPLDSVTGLPRCTIFKSKYTRQQLYAMTERDVWKNLAREIIESDVVKNTRHCKFLAFLSCTRYNGEKWTSSWRHKDMIGATQGHIALGGGGLALLGTGTLHTWSDSVVNLVPCLTDDTMIDKSLLMDDSAYRGTYWANYATGIGAALHELGHTFDLSHTESGIMSRGFDNIHLAFVLPGSSLVEQKVTSQSDKLSKLQLQLSKLHKQAEDNLKTTVTGSSCSLVQNIDFLNRSLPITSQSTPQSPDGYRQSCGLWAQTVTSLSNNQISPLSPPVILCFQLPFFSDSTQAINTKIPIKHLPSAATRDDSCDKSSSVDHEYSNSVMSSTGNEVASKWSVESAVMMRHSRWLMSDDEIMKTSDQRQASLHKPVMDKGQVVMEGGILVIQIYLKCRDKNLKSFHYPHSDIITTSVDIETLELNDLRHNPDCDNNNLCIGLQIRDKGGKIHYLTLN